MEAADEFLAGLKNVMEARKLKPAPLSEKAGLGTSAIRDLTRGKAASPKLSTALKISAALGMSIEDVIAAAHGSLPSGAVEIAGSVGAGARVPVFQVYEKGTGPKIEVPAGIPTSGIVAVEVEGDSMAPVYAPGEMLLYTRHTSEGVPDDAIGRICVIEDEDGMGWVKHLRAGDEPGLFHLVSVNPGSDTMWNKRVNWAARVRFNLPPEVVRKVPA